MAEQARNKTSNVLITHNGETHCVIEVCDKNGNSKNILCDISPDTYICDIRESVLNSIIDSYLYKGV